MAKHKLTNEDKVAQKIADIVSDGRLDLDEIGKVIATAHPHLTFRRLECIIESAQEEKEANIVRIKQDSLWR